MKKLINRQSLITSHQFFQHKNTHIFKTKKRKSANSYPRRHEKKESSAKSLNDIKKVKKKEREKLSPEAREKRIAPQSLQMTSKKSILRFRSNRTMDRIHGSDPWIRSMDQIHGSDPWIWSQWVPRESQKGPKETQASPKGSQETPRHFATKTSKVATAFNKFWKGGPHKSNASTIFFWNA